MAAPWSGAVRGDDHARANFTGGPALCLSDALARRCRHFPTGFRTALGVPLRQRKSRFCRLRRLLVRMSGRESAARVVVDGHESGLPTRTAHDIAAVARDAMAGPHDAPQLLGIDAKWIDGRGVLVALPLPGLARSLSLDSPARSRTRVTVASDTPTVLASQKAPQPLGHRGCCHGKAGSNSWRTQAFYGPLARQLQSTRSGASGMLGAVHSCRRRLNSEPPCRFKILSQGW